MVDERVNRLCGHLCTLKARRLYLWPPCNAAASGDLCHPDLVRVQHRRTIMDV